jgi:hypothetical protein
VVLLVSLLLLLILSIIGVAGMSTSIFGLRMAGNMQSMYDSFQLADAGRAAAMSDAGSFNGGDQTDIFAGSDAIDTYIVAEVNVVRLLPDVELECPRSPAASSIGFIACEFYTIDSEHEDAVSGARSKIFEGAAKEILAK